MKLADQMRDAVDDVLADTDNLIARARRDGTRQRRRRYALGAVGAAAAVAAIVGGTLVLQPGGSPGDGTSGDRHATGRTTSPTLSGETGKATGRGTAAALAAAVAEVSDGEQSAYGGSSLAPYEEDTGFETTGDLQLTLAGGGNAGEVFLNLQDLAVLDEDPGCNDKWETCDPQPPAHYTCQGYMEDCRARELPNGDTLRTYRDTSEGDVRLVAELLSPAREVRVLASSVNGVLSTEQLVDVVSHEWWGKQLPVEYLQAGRELTDYTDRSTVVGLD